MIMSLKWDGPLAVLDTPMPEGLADYLRSRLAMNDTPKCRACGKSIPKNPKWAYSYYLKRLHCNRACADADRPDILTDYAVSDRGCWIWQGHIDDNGYGKAFDESRPVGRRVDWAHRVSYRRHKGEIPEGHTHEVDHTCQVTSCINPDHLELVTKAEHARRTFARLGKDDLHTQAAVLRISGLTYAGIAEALQMGGQESAFSAVQAAVAKGLVDPDEVPPVPRLSEADRRDIRALYQLGVPQTEIGSWYGVDSSQISRVCSGFTSGHSERRDVA